jgi:hypothetical protein
MQIQELSIDPVTHNEELNPAIWQDYRLRTDVRDKLLQIADHFLNYLNLPDLVVTDLTVSGSNAGYNYSEYSDIDLHLIVKTDGSQEELFTAKKNQYNFTHDIKIRGIPVELYVQPADQTHHSAGIYSVKKNRWLSEPDSSAPTVDPRDVKSKARNYSSLINKAMRSGDIDKCRDAWADLRRLRKAGLESGGEQSIENLAYKLLRARGQIEKLLKYIDKLQSAELSLRERT